MSQIDAKTNQVRYPKMQTLSRILFVLNLPVSWFLFIISPGMQFTTSFDLTVKDLDMNWIVIASYGYTIILFAQLFLLIFNSVKNKKDHWLIICQTLVMSLVASNAIAHKLGAH